ncbi:MAG: alpha-L-rhamnosidase [Pseudomonadota bacterium]|jgi:hypothetical protein|nr:alpha-L-rhamnosidase [Pseudomonadota bacterium]
MKASSFSWGSGVTTVVLFAMVMCRPVPSYAATTSSLHYSVKRFTIGELIANSQTRAILDKYIPGFSTSALAAHTRRRLLKAIQALDPGITNSLLAKINAALKEVPATAAAAELSPPPPDGPTNIPDSELDPARHLLRSRLESVLHEALPEQYIWTVERGKGGDGKEPHYFRDAFELSKLPARATLYIAGPRQARIYLNGKKVGSYQLNLDFPIGVRVYQADVTEALRVGANVIAVEAVRGPMADNEALAPIARHFHDGRVLVAMIVAAARGIQGPPLMMSNGNWRATSGIVPTKWWRRKFDDSSWPRAHDLGGIESAIGLFQGNADAGMYAWPGYDGISPFLAQYRLNAMAVRQVYVGVGTVRNVQSLVRPTPHRLFTVTLPKQRVSVNVAPQVLLDFGREVAGRIELQSESNAPAEVTVQYGESQAEAERQPYLGVDPIYVPSHGTAFGPKSGFRYVIVKFLGGRATAFRAIRLDGIAYPVRYKGYFDSSSHSLNKMWAVGAYTAHLCMQDDIWDGVKRDRNRWAGDLDVSARTIEDVFGTHFLVRATLNRLIGPVPIHRNVNHIPGYSAFWVNTLYEYYLHTGSVRELMSVHDRLVDLLKYMEKDLNRHGVFSDLTHGWSFVDWAPEMYRYDEQTRMATQFEYYQAFNEGAALLGVLHDEKNAARMVALAAQLRAAAQHYMRGKYRTFGTRWQPNAYAVLSGVAGRNEYPAIWQRVLSEVGTRKYRSYVITPYYNFYVVSAMAKMDHRRAALGWIRQYWGGMVNEGATSFWEAYNQSWPKGFGYQENLQAGGSGFHVSLAHGWSSGVTPWLMGQMLGIRPTAGGFSRVDIRPDLLGLRWIKGGEPTPHGILRVSVRRQNGYVTTIVLPPDEIARVSIPVRPHRARVFVNGRYEKSVAVHRGTRAVFILRSQGTYVVTAR